MRCSTLPVARIRSNAQFAEELFLTEVDHSDTIGSFVSALVVIVIISPLFEDGIPIGI